MEQLASLNADKVRVVGVGTQDTEELAVSFQEGAQTEAADLVWSQGGDIWKAYEVTGRHTAILLDSSGEELQRWDRFDADAVTTAIG